MRYFILTVILTILCPNGHSIAAMHKPCKEGYILMFSAPEKYQSFFDVGPLKCVKKVNYFKEIAFPFEFNTKVRCVQGAGALMRSHSREDSYYAVYLISESKKSLIHAADDGVVSIFYKCSSSKQEDVLDNCNYGFGNTVKVLHKDGTIALYAHLSEIFVENNQTVSKNQIIAREGSSGNAGETHLHFALYDPENSKSFFYNKDTYAKSIPYKFKILFSNNQNISFSLGPQELPCNTNNSNRGDIFIQGAKE